jgi:ATP-dependent exoDNAse (exonuclease V) beta subunit
MRDHQNIYAEEKRLFYVASTRAKDYLFLTGNISSNFKISPDSYLKWVFETYELSEENINAVETAREFKDDTGFKLIIHRELQEDLPEDQRVHMDSSAPESEIISKEDIQNIYPLTEDPALQAYSVTQLMIFRENRERYFQHFYLNDGQLNTSAFDREFFDEPGGERWGSIIHKALENLHLRSAKDDQSKIKQLARQFDFDDQNQQIQQKLEKILDRVRREKFMTSLKPKTAYSEYSIELRLEDFILKGIFDLIFKNRQGIWEVIDYKTNKIKASETANLSKKYAFQMKAYALLLASLYPDQQIYPVSLLFTEPMKREKYSYNLLEIEEARLETLNLLHEVYKFETSIFHPASISENNKTPRKKT